MLMSDIYISFWLLTKVFILLYNFAQHIAQCHMEFHWLTVKLILVSQHLLWVVFISFQIRGFACIFPNLGTPPPHWLSTPNSFTIVKVLQVQSPEDISNLLLSFILCYYWVLKTFPLDQVLWCSVPFSRSVVSDSLQPHGLQHARPPCPSPTPRVYSNSYPLIQWCHLTISSSVVPFSSRLQSFPASGSFQWISCSHQVAKVLELQLQHQSFQWIFKTDFL